jgi:hypothetical protein
MKINDPETQAQQGANIITYLRLLHLSILSLYLYLPSSELPPEKQTLIYSGYHKNDLKVNF